MSKIFPDSFKFGVADADLQVIGEQYTLEEEESEETEWRWYARNTDKCFTHTTPDEGVDRYHRWRDDVALMESMGVRHYRTSVSMARMLKRDGSINGRAVEWYTNYFKTLRAAGITVYATLYHWELPDFLREKGGWVNRGTIEWLLKHARAVQEHLGEHIDEYFILNEPWCSSFLSHHLGIHAPGRQNLKDACLAAHHLLLAQGVILEELLSRDRFAKVGTVLNVESAYALTADERDCLAASYADAYFNGWFLEPMYLGHYPEQLSELFGAAAPEVSAEDMAAIRVGQRLHSLGINYYRGDLFTWDDASDLKFKAVLIEGGQTNDLGWPITVPPHYPEGFTDILQQIYYRYRDQGLSRMYVTENGMALHSPWDGTSDTVEDPRRIEYLKSHIGQVHDAILRGVPLEGYFLWTLMDNFEWCHGYKPESCFGIVHVDRKTMRRVRKRSSRWYEDLLRRRVLEVG